MATEQSSPQANEFRKGAEQGYSAAQFNLGVCYVNAEQIFTYKRGFAQSIPSASVRLGKPLGKLASQLIEGGPFAEAFAPVRGPRTSGLDITRAVDIGMGLMTAPVTAEV